MVGDPGIEPGVRLREGVTVPCHTLRPVAHCCWLSQKREAVFTKPPLRRQPENALRRAGGTAILRGLRGLGSGLRSIYEKSMKVL